MKTINIFILTICTAMLLFSSLADARLIIRGGASTGLGGGSNPTYLAPIGTPDLIEDVNLPMLINTQGAHIFSIQPIPFENRRINEVPEDQRCSPEVCEYQFNLSDPFQAKGTGDFYGDINGVIATYKWTIFEPTVQVLNDEGFMINMLGDAVASFDASSITEFTGSHKDVFLDALFPADLGPGNYMLALTSIYEAPAGQEFGKFDSRISVNLNGETFYPWTSIGTQFEVESQRFNLTLVQVSVPATISLFLIAALGLFSWNRRKS